MLERGLDNQKDIWAEKILTIDPKRELVRKAALAGDHSFLMNVGFPKSLTNAMQIWALETPDIITSYIHPGEPRCFYSIIAGLRLSGVVDKLKSSGHILETKVIYYDTVDLYPFAKMPFRVTIGGESIGTNEDVFGILKNHSRDIVSKEYLQEKQNKFSNKLGVLAGGITQTLSLDNTQRKVFHKAIYERLDRFNFLFNKVIQNLQNEVTVDKFLALMHWEVIKDVFDIGDEFKNLEESLGMDSNIYSLDTKYLSTVTRATGQILELYGSDIIKGLVSAGSGQEICEVLCDGSRTYLSVNSSGEFVLISKGKEIKKLTPSQAIEIAIQGLPLSRLENLVLYGLGTNYHCGSEHGERTTVLNILGHKGEALKICTSLQIGSDMNQGVNIIPNMSSYFAYVLFSKENYKKLCLGTIEDSTIKDVTTVSELKDMVIKLNK